MDNEVVWQEPGQESEQELEPNQPESEPEPNQPVADVPERDYDEYAPKNRFSKESIIVCVLHIVRGLLVPALVVFTNIENSTTVSLWPVFVVMVSIICAIIVKGNIKKCFGAMTLYYVLIALLTVWIVGAGGGTTPWGLFFGIIFIGAAGITSVVQLVCCLIVKAFSHGKK